jgi:hypothetical protein
VTPEPETAAGDMLAAELLDTREWAAEIRPGVHPDNGDNEIVLALAALCLEVRALTLAVIASGRE